MSICPSCRQDNPPVARFCLACGTPLAEETRPRAEERKVVSVLFVASLNLGGSVATPGCPPSLALLARLLA